MTQWVLLNVFKRLHALQLNNVFSSALSPIETNSLVT